MSPQQIKGLGKGKGLLCALLIQVTASSGEPVYMQFLCFLLESLYHYNAAGVYSSFRWLSPRSSHFCVTFRILLALAKLTDHQSAAAGGGHNRTKE